MKKFVLLLLLFLPLLAQKCDDRLFSLQAMQKGYRGIRLEDVLRDLSLECEFSIIFEDRQSRGVLHKSLDYVNVHDYSFTELLDFLLGEDLFYSFDTKKRILYLSSYRTKNFSIDYINLSSLVSESRKSIVLGTGTGSAQGTNGGSSYTGGSTQIQEGQGGDSNDYTKITAKSEFTFWNSLRDHLNSLLEGVSAKKDYSIIINKDASIVTVTGTKRELKAVEKFLRKLSDRMHKQVLIEAKLIEVTYNDSQTTGIDWSKFELNLQGSREGYKVRQDGVKINRMGVPNFFLGYNFSMEGLFDFLKKYGDVRVLSNPKILTLNNQPAIINVGDQLSYKYETSATTNIGTAGGAVGTTTYALGQSFVGITLYVIPEITENGEIIMKINPMTTELLDNTPVDRTLPPNIKIKQMTSIVKVPDGERVLIGGLVSKKRQIDRTKVPIVGDVPIIGPLFHSKKRVSKRRELFIVIVPKIVTKRTLPTLDEVEEGGDG